MSILLSSGKGAASKFRDGAKKGRPEKVKRAANDAQFHPYLPTDATVVWNTKISGVDYSLALDKESLDLWCNDNVIDAECDFNDTGSKMEFQLAGKRACLKMQPSSRGTKYRLTLDGAKVPKAKATNQD
ncbi:hypothetical protein BOX15_Mlig018185g1 [Macrostomum lignano]|uniref:CUB domain-containing protein n=2 Tax=Macrostomum lignano TaxID=282301 RepID=A0A1I8GCJ2_9PLAT|nr:hypothetical protein BOX15_Mlig018185g1 [Macrostomum lignano]